MKKKVSNHQGKIHFIISYIILLAIVCNVNAKNYVENWNFENGGDIPDNWIFSGHDKDLIAYKKDSGISDSRCLVISGKTEKWCMAQSKSFKLVEGIKYKLSANFSTDNFEGICRIAVINTGWTWYKQLLPSQGNSDWKYAEIEFEAGSSSDGLFYLVIHCEKINGKVMVDDILLEPIDVEEEEEALKSQIAENLFKNIFPTGSFEGATVPFQRWPRDGNLIAELSEENPKDGSKCLHLINEAGSSTILYTYIPLKPNTEYIIETSVKVLSAPSSLGFKIEFQFIKEGGVNGSAGRTLIQVPLTNTSDDWKTIKQLFATSEDTSKAQFIIILDNSAFELYLDEIIIYQNPDAVKSTYNIHVQDDLFLKIDGQLDENIWVKSDVMEKFYLSSEQDGVPQNNTAVQMAFDQKNLYLSFSCTIADRKDIQAFGCKRDDASLWKDDGIEFFIFPKPGTGYHFIVNTRGIFADYLIFETSFGNDTGLKEDIKWNSGAKSAAVVSKKKFTIEMLVPLSDLNLDLQNFDKILVNFNRTDVKNNELSTFSKLSGQHLKPRNFSTMKKSGDSLILERFTGITSKNTFTIERSEKMFSLIESSEPANISVSSWFQYGGLQLLFRNEKNKNWNEIDAIEEKNFKNIGLHGELAAFSLTMLANFKDRGGLSKLREFNKKYGTRSMMNSESSAVMHMAVEKYGGEILDSTPYGAAKRGTTSIIHPSYSQAALIESTNQLILLKDEPWIFKLFYGRDEPLNNEDQCFSLSKNPNSIFVQGFDAKVKKEFGFGKYGLPDVNNKDRSKNQLLYERSFIAFARTWTAEFKRQREAINRELKKIDPQLKYIPMNLNFIGGVPFDDLSEYDATMGDVIACDPYASWIETAGRGIYNHGFGTKIIRDLVDIQEVMTIVQAFTYKGYNPTVADIKEWVSQALKMGANHIQYYDQDKYMITDPEKYKELMHVNARITSMKKIKMPVKVDIAILYSLYTYMADGVWSEANEAYTTYGILGEKLKCWFKFISDREIEKEKIDLKDYKLIFIPAMRFGTDKIFNDIIIALANGATVVFLDPHSFEYDVQGGAFSSLREKILGIKTGEANKQTSITIPGLSGKFPLYQRRGNVDKVRVNSFSIKTSRSIIGNYSDNSPAIVKGKYGKGTFYYFAANPMSPEIFTDENNWSDFFRIILTENNIPMNENIWKFHIDGK